MTMNRVTPNTNPTMNLRRVAQSRQNRKPGKVPFWAFMNPTPTTGSHVPPELKEKPEKSVREKVEKQVSADDSLITGGLAGFQRKHAETAMRTQKAAGSPEAEKTNPGRPVASTFSKSHLIRQAEQQMRMESVPYSSNEALGERKETRIRPESATDHRIGAGTTSGAGKWTSLPGKPEVTAGRENLSGGGSHAEARLPERSRPQRLNPFDQPRVTGGHVLPEPKEKPEKSVQEKVEKQVSADDSLSTGGLAGFQRKHAETAMRTQKAAGSPEAEKTNPGRPVASTFLKSPLIRQAEQQIRIESVPNSSNEALGERKETRIRPESVTDHRIGAGTTSGAGKWTSLPGKPEVAAGRENLTKGGDEFSTVARLPERSERVNQIIRTGSDGVPQLAGQAKTTGEAMTAAVKPLSHDAYSRPVDKKRVPAHPDHAYGQVAKESRQEKNAVLKGDFLGRPMNKIELWSVYQNINQSADAVDTNSVTRQVSDQLTKWMAKTSFQLEKNGQQKLTITLYPEQLGQVTVSIVSGENGIIARLTAETEKAKELLNSGLSRLKQDFASQNIPVSQIDVTKQQTSLIDQNPRWDQNRHQSFQDSGGHSPGQEKQRRNNTWAVTEKEENQHPFSEWLTGGANGI
ncbi:flagellar hook-length control protein FliK [Sporolactobacillus sp. THM7-4]|nr:flagellar hook-length control protein FliK [Sporolactobacillus sp. THM7-4]